jgi:hypothetical protein
MRFLENEQSALDVVKNGCKKMEDISLQTNGPQFRRRHN